MLVEIIRRLRWMRMFANERLKTSEQSGKQSEKNEEKNVEKKRKTETVERADG